MSYSSILVYVGGDLIGDALIKLPFIYNLRKNNPKAIITWCYGEFGSVYNGILAPLISSQIDNIIPFSKAKTQQFDLIIDTQSEWLTTLKLKYFLKSKYFFSPSINYLFSDFKQSTGYIKPKRLIDKMIGFLEIMGMKTQETYTLNLDQVWKDKALELLPDEKKQKGYVGFAVGAGYREKCWPKEFYIDLAEKIIQEGYQPVIILGPQEKDWIKIFKEKLPNAFYPLQDNRTIKQSPLLTIALAERFIAAVSNDCGIGHMFAAANTPLLTLFGPTTANKFAPKVSRSEVLCAQTFGKNTMKSIPINMVLQKLKTLL